MESVPPATHKQNNFWSWAELIRTYQARHPRVKMIRARFNIIYGPGKLKQVRKFKDPRTDECRTTVEIEF